MSANMYRGQRDRKQKARLDAEKKSSEHRVKESKKRTDAAKARQAAGRASSPSTAASKMREAERREEEATSAASKAADWAKKATKYAREEADLAAKVAKVEQAEAATAQKKAARAQQLTEQRAVADKRILETRVAATETGLAQALRDLPAPKPEKLRVLILGASSEADPEHALRIGREQKRIRASVEASLHRDLVELDVRPAATTADLLDGITKFRPHVVHFSGHSNEDLIVFEDEKDAHHEGVVVTASAFVKAVGATDDPPLLVLLNSCKSAAQIDDLVETVAPFAIGMADEIRDADAINYAAQFYAAVANGQSIASAHASGQAALDLAGLDSSELPTLAWAHDVDPNVTILVMPS